MEYIHTGHSWFTGSSLLIEKKTISRRKKFIFYNKYILCHLFDQAILVNLDHLSLLSYPPVLKIKVRIIYHRLLYIKTVPSGPGTPSVPRAPAGPIGPAGP
jgi:hypothetical protein